MRCRKLITFNTCWSKMTIVIVFLLEHTLKLTELYEMDDELNGIAPPKKRRDLVSLASASANILTISPKDEILKRDVLAMDSHRILDLLAQFKAAKFLNVGLQETRMNNAGAKQIGPYTVLAAAAGPRGQGGT